DAGIEQLILWLRAAASLVCLYKLGIGKCRLGIFVQVFHVRVGGGTVEIEVILLHVFPMIALGVRQPKQSLFQDRINAIPEGERETERLLIVRDARDAIFSPAVGARARLLVAEVIPGGAVWAVIFAHGPPLALAQIWPPLFPWNSLISRLPKTLLLARFHSDLSFC